MITLQKRDPAHPDFTALVKRLDAYLAEKDGEEHSFYAQYNKVELIKHVIVAYNGEIPIGCGAMKPYDAGSVEIKRMYTAPESRNKGVATKILNELERWAMQLGYRKCVLETGKRQHEAVSLYRRLGYELIPNYGQYQNVENSICFAKRL